MIMSSGQLLAASPTGDLSLTQYLRIINFDATKLSQATAVKNTTFGLLSGDLAAKTAADNALAAANTALTNATSAQAADQAKLAADQTAAQNFPTDHHNLIQADIAAVYALAAKVRSDAGNKAQRQADDALLKAAYHKLNDDRQKTNASLLAAITADKTQLAKDASAILTDKASIITLTAADNKAIVKDSQDESKYNTYVSAVTDLTTQYNKDFAACTAAYSASAC